MPEILQKTLDSIGFGTGLAILVALFIILAKSHTTYKKIINERRKINRSELLEEQAEDSLKNTVNSLVKEVNDLASHMEKMSDTLNELTTMVRDHDKTLLDLCNNINSINSRVQILVESDIESFESYIMEEYNRFVKIEQSIDMLSLQKIENIYALYRKEVGEKDDELIEKLMKAIRELKLK